MARALSTYNFEYAPNIYMKEHSKKLLIKEKPNINLEIIDNLYEKVSSHIENARQRIQHSIDTRNSHSLLANRT